MKILALVTLAIMLITAPALAEDEDFEKYFIQLDKKLDMIISGECPPIPECPPAVPCPEEKECLVEFIYDINQLPQTAALTVYRVYADTNGKKFLIPTWAIKPTPLPPDVDPPVDPPVEPPIIGKVKDNACSQCHKGSDSDVQLSSARGWKKGDRGHTRSAHRNLACTKCHNG